MHLRLIENSDCPPSKAGITRLSNTLKDLGIATLSPVSIHTRGTYAVDLDIASGRIEDILSCLSDRGFHAVI